jgi:hypothetical protein
MSATGVKSRNYSSSVGTVDSSSSGSRGSDSSSGSVSSSSNSNSAAALLAKIRDVIPFDVPGRKELGILAILLWHHGISRAMKSCTTKLPLPPVLISVLAALGGLGLTHVTEGQEGVDCVINYFTQSVDFLGNWMALWLVSVIPALTWMPVLPSAPFFSPLAFCPSRFSPPLLSSAPFSPSPFCSLLLPFASFCSLLASD